MTTVRRPSRPAPLGADRDTAEGEALTAGQGFQRAGQPSTRDVVADRLAERGEPGVSDALHNPGDFLRQAGDERFFSVFAVEPHGRAVRADQQIGVERLLVYAVDVVPGVTLQPAGDLVEAERYGWPAGRLADQASLALVGAVVRVLVLVPEYG